MTYAIDEHHRKYSKLGWFSCVDRAFPNTFSVKTTWHSLETCAMKPRERKGVVEASLNVYGVKGLKVARQYYCETAIAISSLNVSR